MNGRGFNFFNFWSHTINANRVYYVGKVCVRRVEEMGEGVLVLRHNIFHSKEKDCVGVCERKGEGECVFGMCDVTSTELYIYAASWNGKV